MNAKALDKRSWVIGGTVAAAVVAAAGWFLVISPARSDASSINAQAAGVDQQNSVLRDKVARLESKQAQLGARQVELRTALAALPLDNGLPSFTRQLSAEARTYGVKITSVDVGGVTPVTATGTTGTPGATGTTDPATTPATTTTPAAGPAPAPANPAAGGVVGIAISLTSSGPANRQLAFLHAIQAVGPRRALVNSVNLTGVGSTTGGVTCIMSSSITVFATPKSTSERARIAKLLTQK